MILTGIPRPIQIRCEGESSLGGTDVDKYPDHHFVFNSNVQFESRWPLKVIVCGDDEWVGGCSRFRRKCNIFSLELITEGRLAFRQRERDYEVGAGEMLVIQPGLDYVMSADGYCRKKIMILGGYMLPALLAAGGWSGVDVLRPDAPESVAEYFDRVYTAGVERQPGYLHYCSAQAYQLLLTLSGDISPVGIPAELSRIICFMEENLAGNLTVEELGRRFGMSRTSLFRLFKKHFDCSPADYLIRKRLLIARDLLESSHYSIKEIASRLGYANQFFFSHQFKQKFRVSPRAFRQSLASSGSNPA